MRHVQMTIYTFLQNHIIIIINIYIAPFFEETQMVKLRLVSLSYISYKFVPEHHHGYISINRKRKPSLEVNNRSVLI